MQYYQSWKRRVDKKYKVIYKRGPSTLALIFAGMALAGWAIFIGLSSFPVGAYLYYTVVPSTSKILAEALSQTGRAVAGEPNPVSEDKPVIQRDPTLPEGQYLAIPKIGLDTEIWEAPYTDYERVLHKGVWRVPDFADPTVEGKPMILAAHRFGYLEWTQAHRLKNSFYNLPKLSGGDQIAVVWGQHRYVYRVDRVVEGTEIDDYQADLILYTCKFLVSPVRIFVYASLVE